LKAKLKILLVEDEQAQLFLLAEGLREEGGYTVLTAEDGQEAMKIAEEEEPEIIISDFYMPGMTGMDLCARVRAHPVLKNAMFLLLTSATDIDLKVKSLEDGADDFISKPYELKEVHARVRVAIRLKSMRDEIAADKKRLEQLHATMAQDFAGIISLLTKVLGLRVPDAGARARKASEIASFIAQRLDIAGEDAASLDLAARMHELGKITLPDALLRKPPSALTPEEQQSIAEYPMLGQILVADIPQLADVGIIVRHQCENYDGTGYPDRVGQAVIPLPSRILRGVILLENLSADIAASTETALEAIAKARGTILDPRVALLLSQYVEISHNPSWRDGKKQVDVRDLKEGMVIAIDLTTGSGVKLLPKETKITAANISRILAHHHHDPIVNDIYVHDNT
jgi:response regulator RpfG family c-di-GMP phosphodiesterase